jgi:hexulose-6-phosphate isomerase
MKKGVNAWIYPSGFTVDDVLEASKKIGYDGVELNFDKEMLKLDRKDRELIAEKADSLNIELPSICTGLFWEFNLASPEERIREKAVEVLKAMCGFASDVGARVVLAVPAVAVPELSYQETWQLSTKSILEAAPVAEDCDVTIGVENVWNKFLYSPLEFRSFIEEINHPRVKAYFDAGNIQFLGFPQQWVRHLGDLIVSVHVKGFHTPAPFKPEFVPLLQGSVQWREVVDALREVGYDGFLIVEVPPYPAHPTKSAADSKASLDIILGDKQYGIE